MNISMDYLPFSIIHDAKITRNKILNITIIHNITMHYMLRNFKAQYAHILIKTSAGGSNH